MFKHDAYCLRVRLLLFRAKTLLELETALVNSFQLALLGLAVQLMNTKSHDMREARFRAVDTCSHLKEKQQVSA